MSNAPSLIEITGLAKQYGAPEPLRVAALRLSHRERVVLSGFDRAAAETFVNLITGASVPDAGDVVVDGQNTRQISTDTEWLTSLDRFGIVTGRAILVGSLSIAANLALPLTLSVDPMSAEIERTVHGLAEEVGLERERLAAPAEQLSAAEKVRVHVARAIAIGPQVLVLEHPTVELSGHEPASIAAMVRSVVGARQLALVALSDDETFAKALGMTRLRLDRARGELRQAGGLLARLGFK